jgi:hypothetical protein
MIDQVKVIVHSPVFWGLVAGGLTAGALAVHAITMREALAFWTVQFGTLKATLAYQNRKAGG